MKDNLTIFEGNQANEIFNYILSYKEAIATTHNNLTLSKKEKQCKTDTITLGVLSKTEVLIK